MEGGDLVLPFEDLIVMPQEVGTVEREFFTWRIPSSGSLWDYEEFRSPEFSGRGDERWRLGWFCGGGVYLYNATVKKVKASVKVYLSLRDGGLKKICDVVCPARQGLAIIGTLCRAEALASTIDDHLILHVNISTGSKECESAPRDHMSTELVTTDLKADFSKLLHTGYYSDFTIRVEDAQFKVHKCVLATRSEYFANLLNSPMKESNEGEIIMKDYNKQTVESLLYFLYSGKLPTPQDSEALLLMADKYGLDKLKNCCASNLLNDLTVANVCQRLSTAELLGLTSLKEACLLFMSKNWNEVLDSLEFDELMINQTKLAKEAIKRAKK